MSEGDDETKRLRFYMGLDEAGEPKADKAKGSLGDVLRDRGRTDRATPDEDDDIATIWESQDKKAKEDAWLSLEYKQAKERARQLKKKLRHSQMGDEELIPSRLKESVEAVIKKPLKRREIASRAISKEIKEDGDISHEGRGLPRVIVVAASSLKKGARILISQLPRLKPLVSSRKRIAASVGVACVVSLLGIRLFIGGPAAVNNGQGQGESASSEQTATGVAGASDEKPPFSMLFPIGKSSSDYEVVKVSPEGNDPVFAYIDELEGVRLRISQQKLPQAIAANPTVEIEKLATSFQATSMIQIDSTSVYHGVSEKNKVQSLIFFKNDILVFIAAENKIPDDTWAGYLGGFSQEQ